jgi:predicted metal-dependent peptidase
MSSANIDQRIIKARTALIAARPFFGALALHLQPVQTTSCPRLATDGRHLFYNVEFLDTVTSEELKGIIAHEVYHCALKRHTRRNGRDPKEWNQATDFVINPMVLKAGLKLPTWVLLDPQYDGLSAEQVYRIRQQKRQQQQQERDRQAHQLQRGNHGEQSDADGQSDEGKPKDAGDQREPDKDPSNDSANDGDEPHDTDPPEEFHGEEGGAAGDDDCDTGGDLDEEHFDGEANHANATGNRHGGHQDQDGDSLNEPSDSNDPSGCGEILDAAPETDAGSLAEQEAEWDVRVRQAVNVATKTAGSVPGFLAPIVEQDKEAKHDWRQELRRFIDPSQRKEYSWSRPNRRFLSAGLILPGFVPDGVNHLAWIVDTSSSIDLEALARAGAEGQAALDEGAVDKISVVYCDAVVQRVSVFLPGELIDFNPVGRGGTKFAPAFEWLKENEPDIAGAVYITDLDVYSGDFGDEPPFPVLWAVHGDPRSESNPWTAQLKGPNRLLVATIQLIVCNACPIGGHGSWSNRSMMRCSSLQSLHQWADAVAKAARL